ncbi:hypothetical protein OPIT5_26410 [Opitutaceae bacterium TAV5]|nr:hypothetical protein OPIT5_26410 [Opitutaceae bacterium TAV5]
MIVDLDRFIEGERPRWEQLEDILDALARDPWRRLALDEARDLERLYQRAAADLARLATFSAGPETRRYLENLVARGHAEIHGGRTARGNGGDDDGCWRERWRGRFRRFAGWLGQTFPDAFRRRSRAFALAVTLMIAGMIFGGAAMALDPEAKAVIMPFSHLLDSPSERVAKEERRAGNPGRDRLAGRKATFAGELMTHNTKVTIFLMALGITWGVGTVVLLFYNGVILGAVIVDYVLGGQTVFLAGWLLPHGSVEIPAVLIGGQAGLVLAGALLGSEGGAGRRGGLRRPGLRMRLRAVTPDLVTLCLGAGVMLVWAGVVEAFFSQYHEPVLPYVAKIGFGLVQLAGVAWWLGLCGTGKRGGSRHAGKTGDAGAAGAPGRRRA